MVKTLPSALLQLENFSCLLHQRVLFHPITIQVADTVHVQATNGVGKTTLLKALYGLSIEICGNVYWRGKRCETGLAGESVYINDRNGVFPYLTAQESLQKSLILSNDLAELDQIDSTLEHVGLHKQRMQLCSTLSRGQKKRLHIARLCLQKRALWLLDEPYDGLDSAGCQLLTRLITAHNTGGGIVVYTSHVQQKLHHVGRTVTLEEYVP